MLRLVLGTDWVRSREWILKEIAGAVAREEPGQILIVPELISHDTERRLCAAAGDTASRFAEVLSFPRLLRAVAEQEELAVPECMDGGGRLIAMAATARMLSSRLKSYAAVETRPEFLTGLLDAVDEFKRCCIQPEDLTRAAAETGGTLAQKLEELALILQGYDSITAQGKQDPRDQMNWLLEELECCDFAQRHNFYMDGFPDLTRQHMEILGHLIGQAPMVTVSLCCDKVKSEHPAFETAGRTAADVLALARKQGVEVQIIRVDPRQDALEPLRQGLFQGQIIPRDMKAHLTLVRSDSVFDECLNAAEQVRELVRSGARYRDISIVLADPAGYRGILSLVFRRCGIPLYLAGTDDILQKNAVATLLTALDAAMEGLEQQTVLRYLKSLLSPLGPEECDLVENYAILWGIRGEKWTKEWTQHPNGLGKDWDEERRTALETLNQLRARAIGPVAALRTALRTAKTLADQVDGLCAFLAQVDYAKRLETLADQADRTGDRRGAQEYNQLWEILVTALEQLKLVLGAQSWEPEAFSRLLKLLLSQYDVGTIPAALDGVNAGAVSAMRCQQGKYLLVLGAGEGNLPSYGGSGGVLTDQERTELRRLGVSLTGGAMDGVAAEFAEIYGCFCGAEERVYLSAPAGQSAVVYRRLCTLAGVADGESRTPQAGAALADPWEAGAALAQYGAEEDAKRLGVAEGYRQAKAKAGFSLGLVAPERVRELYGKKLTLSASQIDQQAECRLAYFLKYGLRAKERKQADIDPAEFGTFVHSVLEQTARRIMELGGFHQVPLDQTMEIARGYAKEYAEQRFQGLESERVVYLFQRNALELDAVVEELWRELSVSKFVPVDFELHFGRDGAMPAVQIPGEKMDAVLQGFVDRVDRFTDEKGNYFRVVDYKTGKKDFDYCDVFNGVGLQMLLYLFALEQGGERVLGDNPQGAGVQYFPARFPYLSKDGHLDEAAAEKARTPDLKRKGLVLHDEDVIQAMEPGEELKRLSVKRKADGTLTGDIAGRQELNTLKEYLFQLVGRMVDDIAGGDVSPNPYTRGTAHSACSWCPYGAICARDRDQGRRNYKAMTGKRFWEEIGKEGIGHGGNTDT